MALIGIVPASVITENSIKILPSDYLGNPTAENQAIKAAKTRIKQGRTALKNAKLEKIKGIALRKKYKVKIIWMKKLIF